jgi:hypothetical protein
VIWTTTEDTGIYRWKRRWLSAIDVCLQSSNNHYDTPCSMLFNLFNHFNICILTLPLHIYDINSYYCIFVCWIPSWRWPKKAETCGRITTPLYITLSNYYIFAGIYMVTCLTARNTDNFKFYYYVHRSPPLGFDHSRLNPDFKNKENNSKLQKLLNTYQLFIVT